MRSPKTAETHAGTIFTTVGPLPAIDDHRRAPAVISYLGTAWPAK